MKKILVLGLAAGLATLSACNSTPREQAADNIEANAEGMADNLEDMADNVSSPAAEAGLENQAEAHQRSRHQFVERYVSAIN
jgi:hypothetical protein